MLITESKLRKIIAEEYAQMMKEVEPPQDIGSEHGNPNSEPGGQAGKVRKVVSFRIDDAQLTVNIPDLIKDKEYTFDIVKDIDGKEERSVIKAKFDFSVQDAKGAHLYFKSSRTNNTISLSSKSKNSLPIKGKVKSVSLK